MSLLVSQLVITRKIGNGHFGEVYLAEDEVHGEVAVKILTRLSTESDLAWRDRRNGLRKEAQNLSKATHRNVVQVYHCLVGEGGQNIQFVMALCRGGSLQSVFDAGPSKLSAVRRIATEVTFGLQALHQRGMLHRDIKPANILLDNHGVAQLGDFGLVTDDLVLGYASAAGYSDHLAYEIWHGRGTTAKSDIWALGMTLYRLLHGKNWYDRQIAGRHLIRDGGFVDSLRWLPHIPAKWRRLIRKMMHDDSSTRYQNCEQLLTAFADLPVEPDWECKVSDSDVQWTRSTKSRDIRVTWATHSARKHSWVATSEPKAVGRARRLAGSTDVISATTCVDELRKFLSA